ncbi:Uncharacterized protein APZ42_011448 [Daphnia magna]|uniref:Uncharacterized protein n=1 Tax=Daphnia magna TaxID=35525 RepID=A0A0P5QL43_9CRUS|nr:Uncharacterized protein APZ42_011448 [Daphnia magna]
MFRASIQHGVLLLRCHKRPWKLLAVDDGWMKNQWLNTHQNHARFTTALRQIIHITQRQLTV